jgi:hypothetical protein
MFLETSPASELNTPPGIPPLAADCRTPAPRESAPEGAWKRTMSPIHGVYSGSAETVTCWPGRSVGRIAPEGTRHGCAGSVVFEAAWRSSATVSAYKRAADRVASAASESTRKSPAHSWTLLAQLMRGAGGAWRFLRRLRRVLSGSCVIDSGGVCRHHADKLPQSACATATGERYRQPRRIRAGPAGNQR